MSDAKQDPAAEPTPTAAPAPTPAPPAPDPQREVTPEANPEAVGAATQFYRNMVRRVSEFLHDPKSNLSGPNRLIAELLDRRDAIICSQAHAEKIKAWEAEWQRLQKIVNDHDVFAAARAFALQQEELAGQVTTPEEHAKTQVLAREGLEQKFLLTRESAKQAQQKLFAANIETARAVSETAAEILAEHAVTLEAAEKARFAEYGLIYHGSELVNAVQRARQSLLGRVQANMGQAPPSLLMPWLIL